MTSPKVSDSTRALLSDRAYEYNQQLSGSSAEKYLLEDRGLSREAIEFFQLGYVETPMKNDQMHRGRIVIPYQTRTGVVALRSMSIPDSNGTRPEPKYLPWMVGDVSRPFNTSALDTAPEVYIIEGEMDTITGWMMGLYVVGIPGVSNWKDVYRPMFRYRRVTIIADNDDMGQGREFAKTVAGKLGGASIIECEKGHDLNSTLAEKGLDYCKKMILGSD